MKKKIEYKTAKLFSDIHIKQLEKKIFYRLSNLLNPKFLGVKKDFFHDKVCLDAASGINANATINLINMGAKHVHLFDMNKKILSVTKNYLNKKYSKDKFTIKHSNLLKIDYPDDYFDFVHCAGAIHHTTNWIKSLNNLCRVTKSGGILYVEYYGKGGVVHEVVDLLRYKYKKDKDFKKFIQSLNERTFKDIIAFIKKENSINKVNKFYKNEYISFLQYFDFDSILTIKDRIQSPLYTQIKTVDLIKILKKNKFYQIKRLSRFPIFENYRKFLSPFYKNYNNYFSKILYGEGIPQIICKKK